MTRRVAVFFYGSFMNAAVLKEGGFELGTFEVARLADFDVSAQPLITVVPAKDKVVYGISCLATPAELQRLYYDQWPYRAERRPDYWPEAVEVVSAVDDGKRWSALCYVSAQRAPERPTAEYLARVTGPARAYRFPPWYVDRLEALRT